MAIKTRNNIYVRRSDKVTVSGNGQVYERSKLMILGMSLRFSAGLACVFKRNPIIL